jgi:putative superfamily III holin-X
MSSLSPDKERIHANGHRPTEADTDFPHMIGSLVGQISKLARLEVQLAKTEIKQSAKQGAKDSVGLIAGGLTLNAGLLTLVAAAGAALATVMPLWGALLLVATVLLVGGAAITKAAASRLQDDARLEHLPRSLERNKEFLKEQVA